ncbi:DUF6160 family protein [Paucibacter sp. AS339]|uniref:DUF6160 family protein n=1 Tax=Paucibacter hankyongi TaxID=3133434 RepID=UPI0030B32DB2
MQETASNFIERFINKPGDTQMNAFKLSAVAALLAAASLSASAMTAIDDNALAQVSGQDGVSIAGDLNINIGSFKYTDTDGTGGSVSFNNIGITGLFVMTVDILKGVTATDIAAVKAASTAAATAAGGGAAGAAAYASTMGAALAPQIIAGTAVGQMAASIGSRLAATGDATTTVGAELVKMVSSGTYLGGDVVQFAFPNAGFAHSLSPSVTVGSIKMGGSDASFGSVAINNIDLQGSKFSIWTH